MSLKTDVSIVLTSQKTISDQVVAESEAVTASESSRVMALREAAWYRSKLAAYEQGNTSEVARMERERTMSLETQLSQTLHDRTSLDRRLASMQEQIKLEAQLRTSAEERLSMASKRAVAAEAAQMNVYDEVTSLQKRLYTAECSLRDYTERTISLSAQAEREQAEHKLTRSARDDADALASAHGASLDQLKAALAATGARADEHQRLYIQHRDLARTHQDSVKALQTQIDQRNREASVAQQRVEELERLLHAAESEAAAHRLASTQSLAQVTQTRDLVAQRSANAVTPPEVEDKLHALEETISSLREMHSASRSAVDEATTELGQLRDRNMSLEKQHSGLQSELDVLRAQLAIALQEMARLKDKVATKSLQLHDATRSTETSHIKLQLLRDYMSERGLAPPDDAEASGNGVEAQLASLQNEARDKTRVMSELRSKLADAQVEINTLKRELAGIVAQPALDEAVRRADAFERELASTTESFKERMSQLESDYYAAVSYVKGSEKMLRKMRDSLARTKQENGRLTEEVEQLKNASSSTPRSGTVSSDQVEDVTALQARLAMLSSTNNEITAENRDLEHRMASLISEQKEAYERSRSQLDAATEAGRGVQKLEGQVASLESALSATRQELQKTLALNQHLARELAGAEEVPTDAHTISSTSAAPDGVH